MLKQGEFVFVDGQKIKLDGNGLRTPTKVERQKGLPKSISEAKAKGLNVYQIPGQPAKIMRYKTRQKEDSLGLKAEHENFETRKDNRFGKGGAGKGKRGDAEKLASPDPEVRSKANKKMAKISAKGKVGHHGLLISSYAKGKAEAIAKGGPEAGKLFDQRYASAGLKGGAHSVGNIYEMSHAEHDKLHGKTEPKYFKAIKKAGKKADSILGRLNNLKINGNGNGNKNGTVTEKVTAKNGKNGSNGGLKIGAGSSNSFNGNLTKPSLADEAFKHLNLESYHKIRTPLGIMPRA